jgi:Fe-S-cluster containining protein
MHNAIESLFAAADEAVAAIKRDFSREVRCRKGCADCCHAVFDVSLAEARLLRRHFETLTRRERRAALARADRALAAWNALAAEQADISIARIRCPLLTDQGVCICYDARPINCRTYGVPTAIRGAGHVCGQSGFEQGQTYPTINLAPIQDRLLALSIELGGEKLGLMRWPVAAVLLDANELAGRPG